MLFYQSDMTSACMAFEKCVAVGITGIPWPIAIKETRRFQSREVHHQSSMQSISCLRIELHQGTIDQKTL